MPEFVIDYSYKLPEWNSITVEADDLEHAELLALQDIKDIFPDIIDVVIEEVYPLPNETVVV